MQTSYLAYGLRLAAGFPLPGMVPQEAHDLPSLSLHLRAPAELERLWSGAGGPPAWQGRLGDGLDLTMEHGLADDILFSYGDRARFLLDAGGQTLVCAPRRTGDLDWQRALLSKVIASISVMRGYEALHASAVESPHGAVAVLAPSGTGKTTLAIELMNRGWPLIADDVLALDDTHDTVMAHPATPHLNVAERGPHGLAGRRIGRTIGVLREELWLAARAVAHQARPLHVVCLLRRGPGLPLRAEVLPASPLPLAPYMLGLPGDTERERRRFSLYANAMSSARLVALSCDLADPCAKVADLVEEIVAGQTMVLAGALA